MMIFIEREVAFFTACITLLAGAFGVGAERINKKAENFRVTTYIRGDYVQSRESIYDEDFDIITDVIFLSVRLLTARAMSILKRISLKQLLIISAMQ